MGFAEVPPERKILTRRQILSKRSFRMGPDERDDRGWTLLHVVSHRGDRREVKRLLENGMDVNVPSWGPKSHGMTPLHAAAKGGHLKVMDTLLEHGADIDAKTKGACGWTPLHIAAKESRKVVIKFLLENGAFLADDINDTRFNPPLHYCPGLEWAYEIKRYIELEELASSSSES